MSGKRMVIDNSRFWGLVFLAMLLFIVCNGASLSFASDRLPPMAKKNKNEVTDFFDKEIESRKSFQQKMEESRNIGIKSLENKEAINNLPDTSGISNKAEELKKLNQNQAEEAGYKVKAENKEFLDKAHLNYKDPLVIRHKEDIAKIVSGTEKLLSKLYEKLKTLGIDCRQKKGPKEVEPEMYIEIESLPQKEVIYDKFLCEAPRRQYTCKDELTVKCIRQGKRYSDWQYKTIRFGGRALHDEKTDWGFAVKWRRKEWGWYITPHHPKKGIFGYGEKQVDSPWRDNPPAIINDARFYIAGKLNVGLDQIREDIIFPPGGKGIGHTGTVSSGRWRHAWAEYEFGYYYREAFPICTQWSEDWHEDCKLQ